MASSPTLISLLILIHVQVPSLAPVRQIDATPKPKAEDENDDEDEDDLGRKEGSKQARTR